jgi:putative hemolysin
MDVREQRTPIQLPPILPAVLRRFAQPIEPALTRFVFPDRVADALKSVRERYEGVGFAAALLEALHIEFAVEPEHLQRIPASGPLLAVANHPFGIVEGLVLATLLERVRPDWKIVANSLLSGLPELKSKLLLVNPFDTMAARRENVAPLRESMVWIAEGKLLVIFPGGEVASLNLADHSVTDPPWKTTAARIALRARCPVLPIFFPGCNTAPFHLAGAIHPMLRTLSLVREFEKLRGRTNRDRIGQPISVSALAA